MQITSDRRALHRIPETELALPETMAYLTGVLTPLRCRLFSPMESCLCALFDFGADHAIAFRADCDALPIQEATGLAFASRHPGRMHACGHDGHMAIALELARRLDKMEQLPHNVLLVFQPGEESPGGAALLCQSGVFQAHRVTAIFGLHLWPGLPAGEVFSRPGPLMARASEVNVEITGKTAHIASAHQGIDALAAMVDFYQQVTALESALPEQTLRLLKFGKMTAGTVRNAISAQARMEGSLRAFDDEVFETLRRGIYAAAQAVEQRFGCTCTVTMSQGYPAVCNPEALYHRVERAVHVQQLAQPSMTAEDFSHYQKLLPGQFFFLGIGDTPALHNDHFDFDESLLSVGADFWEELAVRFR